MNRPSLVILAAGMGSRYGGLKQIDPVGPDGEIILDYTLYDARRAGFDRAIFVIRPEQEAAFRQRFRDRPAGGLEIVFAPQRLDDLPKGFSVPADREKPWGTGQAVWAARKSVRGPFAVANADDFYGRGSFAILGRRLGEESGGDERGCCLVAFRLDRTLSPHGSVSRGVCQVDGDGHLISIVERTRIESGPEGGGRFLNEMGRWQRLSGREAVSMNLWGFPPTLFSLLQDRFAEFLDRIGNDRQAEFQIPAAVDRLIRERKTRCAVLSTGESWFGLTYREDRDRVVQQIAELTAAGIYPPGLRD